MPRTLRYIPQPNTLVETTCRIIHGRKLLRPSSWLNEMIVGTLAVAKRRFNVRICGVAVLSNHFHMLLVVDNAQHLARFMSFVCSKIAREVSRETGWKEKVWGRRFTGISVSTETGAQVARLAYLLSHGVKEGLVERCSDWPGVHSAEPTITGKPMAGYWFDRTAEYKASRRGKKSEPETFARAERLKFAPLPCWKHLTKKQYRAQTARLVEEIESTYTSARKSNRPRALDITVIRSQDPFEPTPRTKRSSPPLIHAASRAMRQVLLEAYRLFVAAYRAAADRLRAGVKTVEFPHGCFPPPLPFVER